MQRVAVIGGGVIGLATGVFLAEGGATVTVLERGQFGAKTSSGNLAWITPGVSSSPLAAPGVIGQAIKWMLNRDSPFWIRPRLDWQLVPWLWTFRVACSRTQFEKSMRALVALNSSVLGLLEDLRSRGVEFEFHRAGLLYPALSETAIEKDAKLYQALTDAGYSGEWEVLDVDTIHNLEPALSANVRGGVYSKGEGHIRPESFTRGLAQYLRAKGTDLIESAEVVGIERRQQEWVVKLENSELVVDAIVVAAGVWTDTILKTVGLRLNLLAGKGYSITYQNGPRVVSRPLYLSEAHAGVTPFDGALRIGGTLELTGIDPVLRSRRLEAIRRSVSRYLPSDTWRQGGFEWAGLRPLVPDGLPVIGEIPERQGLYVATGHGMVGMTMSTSTGAALARAILEGRREPLLEPFAPARVLRRVTVSTRVPSRGA